MSGWNAETSANLAGSGALTIVEGSSFAVSAVTGDILPGQFQGVYFRDTRFISTWKLLINDHPLECLSATVPKPYRAVFVGRAVGRPGRGDSPLIVERTRQVGVGLREEFVLHNYSTEPIEFTIDLEVGADFADLFEVKGGTVHRTWTQSISEQDGTLAIDSEWKDRQRGLRVSAPAAIIAREQLHFGATIPPRGQWTTTIVATPTIDGELITSGFPAHLPLSDSRAARRFRAWVSKLPVTSVDDPSVRKTLERSDIDLGSLRIHYPDHPEREVVAAGAPWFMALFGRDSILTSYMALPVDPGLALGTLQTLAEFQGTKSEARTEEQPGRILHEVRLGVDVSLALGGEGVYYGSVDATPLFVTLLGELQRWRGASEETAALLPAADRALDWIAEYGDRDGDGFVEYQRSDPQGLINQGWKDSWDGVNFADGSLAEPPIALCEVQGYVYSAYVARGLLASSAGDEEEAQRWAARAAALKREFNERFWLDDRGYFAIALDRDKRQVDACASNMGHCLWSGIVDDDKAALVGERLLSPEMFSGWGVRTLGTDMGAYNPASYHNGSVWPHDNALIVAGLMRYGLVEQAHRVAFAVLDAAESFGGRLPELFCGFDRDLYPEPVAYPTSCSPQAWASAAPISLLRSLARLDPCVPDGVVWLAPTFPQSFGDVFVDQMPLGGGRVSVELTGTQGHISGLPEGITVQSSPRPTSHELSELQRA
ncbi:glycogen debranching N-terminal domain-containing protein [Parafrigoribacterium mesophilum]|uniref:amylo-alpha-1,6-glucosidase n=1 Tax=Parafrigoribacterium mesophilum TaxID=433646 RepID=UPI0031FE1492